MGRPAEMGTPECYGFPFESTNKTHQTRCFWLHVDDPKRLEKASPENEHYPYWHVVESTHKNVKGNLVSAGSSFKVPKAGFVPVRGYVGRRFVWVPVPALPALKHATSEPLSLIPI